MTTLTPPVTGVTLEEFLNDPRYGEHDELILGIVWPEMPESPDHFLRAFALEAIFHALFPGRFVSREVPLTIPGEAQPRPDLVVFRAGVDEYMERRSFDSRDALLVAEISLTSHDRDFGPKDKQYARAGIPEYVIVDLKNRYVEVRTEPTPDGYLRRVPLGESGSYRGVPVVDLLDSIPDA